MPGGAVREPVIGCVIVWDEQQRVGSFLPTLCFLTNLVLPRGLEPLLPP